MKRSIFEADEETVQRQCLKIETAISKIQSVDDILRCFVGTADPKTDVHRLLQYDVKQMRGVFGRRQRKVKPAAFLGWLFEGFAHEKLLDGVDLPLRGLNNQARAEWFNPNPTIGNYTKSRLADMETIFEDAYRTSESSTLRSVDSYFLTNAGILWLFQMTRDVDHKINSEGVLELLEKIGKIDGMASVNLVFVIPSNVGDRFPVQSFKLLDVFRPDLTDDQVNDLQCDRIPGIKDRKKRKLHDAGLDTIGDVRRAMTATPEKVSFIRSNILDFEANRRRRGTCRSYCSSSSIAFPSIIDLQTSLTGSDG